MTKHIRVSPGSQQHPHHLCSVIAMSPHHGMQHPKPFGIARVDMQPALQYNSTSSHKYSEYIYSLQNFRDTGVTSARIAALAA